MKHISLFSGIGGFNLACEWLGIETVLNCEIDDFCQKVLKKHWPDVPIVKDVNNVEEIKAIVTAYSQRSRCLHGQTEIQPAEQGEQTLGNSGTGIESSILSTTSDAANHLRQPGCARQDKRRMADEDKEDVNDTAGFRRNFRNTENFRTSARDVNSSGHSNSLLLTAGFPCQPFSNAGRKRGASDNRYLWPATLRVIESIRPDWVCLENVAGLLNMVFPDSISEMGSQASLFPGEGEASRIWDTISGRIESDLRQAGYETVWFVIPACTIGAPHRRDRVWIVAHSCCNRHDTSRFHNSVIQEHQHESIRSGQRWGNEIVRTDNDYGNAPDPGQQGLQREQPGEPLRLSGLGDRIGGNQIPNWQENWYEVATRFCRVDDGLPRVLDRVNRLKALGNAIVPEVAYEILKAVLLAELTRRESI